MRGNAAFGPRRFLGRIVIAAMQEASDSARRAFARYRERREMRASYAALCRLDDHLLRDLGFHRSEIMPVTAEITGEAEYTQMRRLEDLLR